MERNKQWFMLQMDTSLIHFAKLKKSVSKRIQPSKILVYDVLKKAKQQGHPADPRVPQTAGWGSRREQVRSTALPLSPLPTGPCSLSPCLHTCGPFHKDGSTGCMRKGYQVLRPPFLAWEMTRACRGSGQTSGHESIDVSGRGVRGPPLVQGQQEKGGQL